VEKCDRFLFWSKVEAAYGLETVITAITVINSPYDHMDIDHMDVSSSSSASESSRVRVSSNSSWLISAPVCRSDL
jgi:hypothetical protein